MHLRHAIALSVILPVLLLAGCNNKKQADIETVGITGTPVNPTPGTTVTVTVTVKNTGNKNAGSFAWAVNRDDVYGFAGGTIASLSKGETTTLSFPVTETVAGSHSYKVIVNSDNGVSEYDYGNNSDTIGINFALPFDLQVDPLTVVPAAPTTLDTIAITAHVTNAASAAGSAINAIWRVQRDGVDGFASGIVPTLAPGASADVPFSVPFETAGAHTYVFTIDPDGVSTDSDASNNSQSTTVTVIAAAARG